MDGLNVDLAACWFATFFLACVNAYRNANGTGMEWNTCSVFEFANTVVSIKKKVVELRSREDT